MKIALIAAVDKNNIIGRDNKLIWHIPADLKRFKSLTEGNIVLMGRNTFESIGSKPLKNRDNIIVSSTLELPPNQENCFIVSSAEEALKKAKTLSSETDKKLFVIGGWKIYETFLSYCDEIHLTKISCDFGIKDKDCFFPSFNEKDWLLEKETLSIEVGTLTDDPTKQIMNFQTTYQVFHKTNKP